MKHLLAWIVGATLVVSAVGAPRVIADENGKIHYWSSNTSYVPQDEGVTVENNQPVEYVDVSEDTSPAQMMPAMPLPGGHVYMINDDPGYDLTGPSDHWFLVGDGTAFRDENWHDTATFTATGTFHGAEVVPVTAEFRQDWLAVMAGDRPVRTFFAPRAVSGAGVNAMIPMEGPAPTHTEHMAQYSSTEHFRPVYHPRRRMYHATHRVRYTGATYHTATVANEPAVEAQPAVEVQQDRMGNQIFQMGNSWYMKVGDDWYRAESWRGPFAHTHKRTVPREVKQSAKHPSRLDMD